MRAIRLILLAGLSLAAISDTLHAGQGAEFGSGADTNALALSAETRHEEGPGLLPADRAYVRAGTNKFAFLVPTGLKLETWSDGRVALVSRDYSRKITFRIVGPPEPAGIEAGSESWFRRVTAQYPQAKIIKAFSAFADSCRGPAYEIAFVESASLRRGQVAFIPCRVAVLEFSLVCSPEDFEAARQQLNTILLTFRSSDPNGELHISPLSDKL
jgi:hypothetical protein